MLTRGITPRQRIPGKWSIEGGNQLGVRSIALPRLTGEKLGDEHELPGVGTAALSRSHVLRRSVNGCPSSRASGARVRRHTSMGQPTCKGHRQAPSESFGGRRNRVEEAPSLAESHSELADENGVFRAPTLELLLVLQRWRTSWPL